MKLHLVHKYHHICGGGPHAHNACHPRHESTRAFPTSGEALAYAAAITEDDVRGEYVAIEAPAAPFDVAELVLIAANARATASLTVKHGQSLRALETKALSLAFEAVS